ncbi:hypothetical protein GmHk_05G012254 [Glycine max]|nr:hypothetical protein GmHk_05G012254 [Glycine max]
MSRSHASSSRWTSLNEEWNSFLQMCLREWRELANMMQNVVAPPEAFFQTIHARDQVYAVRWNDVLDGVWHLVDKDENYHNVVYNKDLDQPAIVAGWTTLRDFYQLTGDHLVSLHFYGSVTFKVYLTEQKVTCNNLDVPSSMYYFLKDKGWTHLHLEDVVDCPLMFNHYRKTLKIGVGWKHFCETLSLIADMKIVFEFIDPNVNRVLYWPCL